MRKYIFAFFFLFLLVGLVGCKPTKPEGPTEEEIKEDAAISSFESIELITYSENENKDNVVSNITLLKQVDGYPIHWSSDNRVVILIDDDKGIVTQQSSDITVTLKATILVTATKNSERTITIKVLQKPLPKQYIVTFDYDEASGILPTTQTVVEGNKVIKPADPSRDGYEFVGWTLDLESSVLFDFNTIIEEDIKLYAIWEEIEITIYTGYYEGITSYDTGLTLVNKLYNIISVVTAGNGSQNASYGEVRDILMESDINPKNTDYLWGIYDNADIPKIWDGNTMNREHVWPNSRLGDPTPNYLAGITAKNGLGNDFTSQIVVDSSLVDLDKVGVYEVHIYLSSDESVKTSYEVTVRKPAQPGDYTGYYQSLAGLPESALKNELARLIVNTGFATGSTSQVKEVDKWNGSYYLIYTGMGPYGNREHTWPESKLGKVKDDLHNLRAANIDVNSDRSNYPFTENNKSYTGSNPHQLLGSAWYPGDEHIGDVARIVLYISIRYDLPLSRVGNLDMFLKWHELDPVNEFERTRNDRIYTIQKNRNPFIDHPELVEIYFGAPRTSFAASNTLITAALEMINKPYIIRMESNKTYLN